MAFPDKTSQIVALLFDEDGNSIFDRSQRIQTASVIPPTVPLGTTAINISAQSAHTGVVDTPYLITNLKTLTIQCFRGGAESLSKIELFEDPNGDLSVLNLIRVGYATGSNIPDFTLAETFLGDGTRRILLRRTRLSGGNAETSGFWDGFEE